MTRFTKISYALASLFIGVNGYALCSKFGFTFNSDIILYVKDDDLSG